MGEVRQRWRERERRRWRDRQRQRQSDRDRESEAGIYSERDKEIEERDWGGGKLEIHSWHFVLNQFTC